MLRIQHYDAEALDAHDLWYRAGSLFNSLTDCIRIELWVKQNPTWKAEWLNKALEWQKQQIKADAEIEKAKRARDSKLRSVNKLASTCGAAVFKVLIPVLICAVVLAGLYGVYDMVTSISLVTWAYTFYIVTVSAATFVLAQILWDAGATLLNIYGSKKTVVGDALPSLSLWDKFCIKFSGVSEFIRDTVSITYKQECPLIIWGEETGPIQKRVK
jgi:hypothetical protein